MHFKLQIQLSIVIHQGKKYKKTITYYLPSFHCLMVWFVSYANANDSPSKSEKSRNMNKFFVYQKKKKNFPYTFFLGAQLGLKNRDICKRDSWAGGSLSMQSM